MGRMNGPFTAPPHWEHQTITPSEYPELRLLPTPRAAPAIALAFSVQQTGSDGKEKIRRGEDWRRSGHNATCIMHDQPYHHTPAHFAALAIRSHQHNPDQLLHVWGHDHDGAYRQLPLDQPEQAYVLLHTPEGPTLWSHNVLLFGSSASVWGDNSIGDATVSVSRLILLCPTMHYVDDYGSTEASHQADSGFRSFEDFNGALGYNMKTSKRQPPASSHKIQGVIISTDMNHTTLTPCPQRVERMCADITTCLQSNTLEPDQARRMAGKCNFLTGRLFGKVGRAPLKAIYSRAHSNMSHHDKPTRSALHALDPRHHTALQTHADTPTDTTQTFHHHLHRRLLHRRRHQTTTRRRDPGWVATSRLHIGRERVGCRHLPARNDRSSLVMVLPRQTSPRNPETVQLQHCLYLPPRSLGRHHRTDSMRTHLGRLSDGVNGSLQQAGRVPQNDGVRCPQSSHRMLYA